MNISKNKPDLAASMKLSEAYFNELKELSKQPVKIGGPSGSHAITAMANMLNQLNCQVAFLLERLERLEAKAGEC